MLGFNLHLIFSYIYIYIKSCDANGLSDTLRYKEFTDGQTVDG